MPKTRTASKKRSQPDRNVEDRYAEVRPIVKTIVAMVRDGRPVDYPSVLAALP